MSNNISCPNCQTLIVLHTEVFLKGISFTCSNCDVKIGMTEKTDLDQAKMDIFKKFIKIKKKTTSSIPCLDCGSAIPLITKDLLKGNKMVCPNCKVTMTLQR